MSNEDNNQALYEVFEGSAWEAGLLKSILEDNSIYTILTQAYSLPWNTLPTKGSAAKLFVALENLGQARVIVAEFYKNMQKGDTEEPEE